MITLLNTFKDYVITQGFGKTEFAIANSDLYPPGGHNGLDYAMPLKEPVRATHSGIVVRDADKADRFNGVYVAIWAPHMNCATYYLHLTSNVVHIGQKIIVGDIIGYSGNTGASSGAHLHFGLVQTDNDGYRINTDNSFNGFIDPFGELVQWISI